MTTTQADVDAALDIARVIFPLLPQRVLLDPGEPQYGDAYTPNPGILYGVGHIQVAQAYTPTLRVRADDLIHEIGHLFEQALEDKGFGLVQNYIYTRLWAEVFHAKGWGPATWQEAKAAATRGSYIWNQDPGELFAEMFLIAVRGVCTTIKSPTAIGFVKADTYGIPPNPAAMRRLMLELMHERAPVVYPAPPGQTLIAKAADDSLFLFARSTDNAIVAYDGQFAPLGTTPKWW